MGKQITLLLGGARSGKSSTAEQMAAAISPNVLYVATAQAFDAEMHTRIAHHRAARPPQWHTLEVPLLAGAAITQALARASYDVVLLDCMTLLASNALLTLPDDAAHDAADAVILGEVDALMAAWQQADAHWIIVTNEVGMGIVPPTRLGRLYRDALGRANQRLATHADRVLLLVAGIPWQLR